MWSAGPGVLPWSGLRQDTPGICTPAAEWREGSIGLKVRVPSIPSGDSQRDFWAAVHCHVPDTT